MFFFGKGLWLDDDDDDDDDEFFDHFVFESLQET